MSTVEINKASMLVNADKEIVGWFNVGQEVDMKEGDQLVTHHKTAEKMGLLKQFEELKAANKPAKSEKSPKAEGEKAARTRADVPTEGSYTVVKTAAAEDEDCERTRIFSLLLKECTTFEAFWAKAPKTFNHPARDGSIKEFTTSGAVSYAIRRGMITIG